jgi:hypothetical protein
MRSLPQTVPYCEATTIADEQFDAVIDTWAEPPNPLSYQSMQCCGDQNGAVKRYVPNPSDDVNEQGLRNRRKREARSPDAGRAGC